MAFNFKDKVYAVSGAASGMGLATAKLLYSQGATVSVTDNRWDALLAAIPDITSGAQHPKEEPSNDPDFDEHFIFNGDRVLAIVTDVSSSGEVNRWIDQTVRRFGRLDGTANLAGISSKKKLLTDVTDEDWNQMLNVNLTGTFFAVRAQLRAMEKSGMQAGSIVNTSSIYGISGKETSSDYCAAKHGVVGMTRAVAKEVGTKGIRVNAIAPGIIDTRMVRSLPEHFLEGHARTLQYDQALGRMAKAEEVGNLILFLLSDLSSFITGAVYTIDGGQIC